MGGWDWRYLFWRTGDYTRMSERILKGVLHNAAENTILITISDKVKTETLKKIYNILLDEEVKTIDQENKDVK